MAKHFGVEFGDTSLEYKKTDSGCVEQLLFNINQNPEIAANSKFFIKGKSVTLEQMYEEIDAIRLAWLDKKNQTHKQISVIDGVSGLKRKKIWVRR